VWVRTSGELPTPPKVIVELVHPFGNKVMTLPAEVLPVKFEILKFELHPADAIELFQTLFQFAVLPLVG